MSEHPGHFWICFWLLVLALNSCDLVEAVKKNTEAVKELRPRP